MKDTVWRVLGLENIVKQTPDHQPITFIIGISVGGEKQEGKQFAALIQAVNELSEQGKVLKCIIAVCDTLQRHNFRIDGKTSEEQALALSKRRGDEWIARYSFEIKTLRAPYQIVRWEEWRRHKSFEVHLSGVYEFYKQDSVFRDSIKTSIKTFSSRFRNHYKQVKGDEHAIDDKALENCCRHYLLEECAVIMKYWPEYHSNTRKFVLYPGNMTAALKSAYQKFVLDKKSFQWQKYRLKKEVSPSCTLQSATTHSAKKELPEVLNLISQFDKDAQLVFMVAFAGYTGILTSQRPRDETSFFLREFTQMMLGNKDLGKQYSFFLSQFIQPSLEKEEEKEELTHPLNTNSIN